MKQKVRLVEVTISTHCHATEDLERVKNALLNVIPEDLRSSAKFVVQELKGYYGNPITRISTSFRGENAEKVLKYILSKLPDHDKNYLLYSLEQRYDKKSNKVFIRLNKQEAYLGTLTLYEGSDAIKVVASFSIIRSLDEVRKYLEEAIHGVEKDENRSIS